MAIASVNNTFIECTDAKKIYLYLSLDHSTNYDAGKS